jgi:hypothetical protein
MTSNERSKVSKAWRFCQANTLDSVHPFPPPGWRCRAHHRPVAAPSSAGMSLAAAVAPRPSVRQIQTAYAAPGMRVWLGSIISGICSSPSAAAPRRAAQPSGRPPTGAAPPSPATSCRTLAWARHRPGRPAPADQASGGAAAAAPPGTRAAALRRRRRCSAGCRRRCCRAPPGRCSCSRRWRR